MNHIKQSLDIEEKKFKELNVSKKKQKFDYLILEKKLTNLTDSIC
jgi:hypothetical protein